MLGERTDVQFLRFSRETLAAHSDNEPNRVDICNCSTSESTNQEMGELDGDFHQDLQVGNNGPKWTATVDKDQKCFRKSLFE